MEHLIQPIPGPQWCRMQSRWHCSAGEKKMSALSRAHVTFTHTIFHTHTYIRTYVRTYVHTYIRICILSFHILSHTVFHHLLCLSFPVPATTFEAQYWKKLTCGVIRSFNFFEKDAFRCILHFRLYFLCVLHVLASFDASCGFPMFLKPS